jgi:hypothetical protein
MRSQTVPPEVLSAATPKQRAEWGFNPLKHALPVKIQGLQSPEDFVVNPMLMQQLHDHLEGYVGSINYADYCKATGVKLGEHADRGLVAAAKQRARSARLQGEEDSADDITRLGAALEKEGKAKERAAKQAKKLRSELKERDQREELFRRALQGDRAARRELKAMGLL